MAKTLLEKAKAIVPYTGGDAKFSEEELELVSGWMNDEITLTQLTKVLGKKNTGGVYNFLARGARELYRNGGK